MGEENRSLIDLIKVGDRVSGLINASGPIVQINENAEGKKFIWIQVKGEDVLLQKLEGRTTK